MKPFSYTYQGQIHTALADHFLSDGFNCYLITFNDGRLEISASEIPGAGGTIEWMQKSQPGEQFYPNEFIQAIGEGLHDAEAI